MPGLCGEQGCSSTARLFNFSLFLTYFWCVSITVRVLQRNRTRRIYCKEFALTCVGAGKSEARRAGWEAGNSQAGAELAVLRENVFSLRKISVRPFT